MITLNLLPDVKLEYLRTRQIKAKVISIATLVTIVSIGLVVLVAGWVYGGQTIQKAYLTGEIKKHSQELSAVPDVNKYLTIQNQLANLNALHDSKNDFSRLLTFLPLMNPAAPHNVTLTNLELASSVDTGSTLTFQGEVGDYTGLNTFRDTLINAKVRYNGITEKLFDSVVVASSSLEQGQNGNVLVVFNIATIYNPHAFLYSSKDATVIVPQINTTQSVQATPDVFGKSTIKKEQN